MSEIFKLTVGDLSGDGHEKCEDVRFTCNATADEVREGYLAGVKKAGVGLHYPKKNEKFIEVLAEYGAKGFPSKIKEKLDAVGVDFSRIQHEEYYGHVEYFGAEGTAQLFLELVTVGRPGFEYELLSDEVTCINHGEGFRHQIGYGAMSP